jgi:hypothetical protein
MSTQTRAQLNGSGYAAQPVTKPPNWHGLVAWDMLFNNLSAGLFLAAAVGELMLPQVFSPVAKVAYPLALVLLFVDLACLVLDLGDPRRFHHMLRVFKPTSPMSLGTWCLTVYSLPLTVAVALSLLPSPDSDAARLAVEWARTAAVVLALLPALGSAVYKGVLLSTSAQPGWKDARWLGGFLASSALLLGCAELLLLATLLGQERAVVILRVSVVVLLVLNLVPLWLVVASLGPALTRVYTPRQRGRLAVLCVGGGIVLPLVVLLAGGGPIAVLAAVLLLLLASLMMRFVLVRLPQALA